MGSQANPHHDRVVCYLDRVYMIFVYILVGKVWRTVLNQLIEGMPNRTSMESVRFTIVK